MCVCVCVCVYMYIYVCVCVCVYVCVYICVCVYIHIYVYMCVYICIYGFGLTPSPSALCTPPPQTGRSNRVRVTASPDRPGTPCCYIRVFDWVNPGGGCTKR